MRCPNGSCVRKKLGCEKFRSSTCQIRLVIFTRYPPPKALFQKTRPLLALQFTLWLMNALLLVATAAVGLWLWQAQRLEVCVFALALPPAWQITSTAGWGSWEVAGIFENVGVVQEVMDSIARPLGQPDRPGAPALQVMQGEIHFEQLGFAYPAGQPVLRDINVTIRPGERIGLVGRSGAGKSTLVHLLLRFF